MLPNLKLIKATMDNYPTVQNMARFYTYDLSKQCGDQPGWECPEDGLYECFDLKAYFDEIDRHPFLIKVGDELAGFVMINTFGTSVDVQWNMGEFFVLGKFQNKGAGTKIATLIFDQFQGIWECAAMPKNTSAINFWRKTIVKYTKAVLSESMLQVASPNNPTPHPMVVWRFNSMGNI